MFFRSAAFQILIADPTSSRDFLEKIAFNCCNQKVIKLSTIVPSCFHHCSQKHRFSWDQRTKTSPATDITDGDVSFWEVKIYDAYR